MACHRPSRHEIRLQQFALAVLLLVGSSGCQDGFAQTQDGFAQTNVNPQILAAHWISQLGDPSYATRQQAMRELRNAARTDRVLITNLLCNGMTDFSVEQRLSCDWLIKQIRQDAIRHQLKQLNDQEVPIDSIRLPGLRQFVSMAGDDWLSRQFYQRLFDRRSAILHRCGAVDAASFVRADRFDPLRTDSTDHLAWAAMLVLDGYCASRQQASPIRMEPDVRAETALPHVRAQTLLPIGSLASRLALCLSNPALGPKSISGSGIDSLGIESQMLRRLIQSWCEHRRNRLSDHDSLRILVRFGARDQAVQLACGILQQHHPNPQAVASALSVLAMHDADQFRIHVDATRRDRRRIHTGMIGGRSVFAGDPAGDKTANTTRLIVTEVSDVCLAWRLHLQGIDPRHVGFSHLRADPLWGFHAGSLGFTDDDARGRTRAKAAQMLAIQPED